MRIGVIGVGFVGGAVAQVFAEKGHNMILYDKYKEGFGTFEDVLDSEMLFVCLPTPYLDEFGYDLSAITSTFRELSKREYCFPIVLKSSVEPGTCARLANQFKDLKIVYNPEFLTARTAVEDFRNQSHIVLGGRGSYYNYLGVFILYEEAFPDAKISTVTYEEAESMKLFCNNFYAIKVQVFNEFYLLCQRMGADYEVVKDLMLDNNWINEMHTQVPGPDGQLSYGGACYPKDTNALRDFMKRESTPHGVLDACIKERNKMRND